MTSVYGILWFFIVTSGYHSTKHEFTTQEACRSAQVQVARYYQTTACIHDKR